MAIADIVNDTPPPKPRKGPLCEVCDALARLPKAEADALTALLSDTEWRYDQIAAKVSKDPDHPLDIAGSTYARHARGGCYLMRRAGVKLR